MKKNFIQIIESILIVVSIVVIFFINIARATHVNPVLDQTHYRWRNDDGSETTATWKAAVNTAITDVATNAKLRLRLGVTETAGGKFKGYDATIQFSTDANDDCAAGTWTTVDTVNTTWIIVDSPNFTDGEPTTQQITTASFVAGQMKDAGNTAAAVDLTSQATEHEWMLQGNGAAPNTTYWFRTTDNGTALNNYTVCAKLTTGAAAVVSVTVGDGVVDYGIVSLGGSQDTITLFDTQTATNDGNVTENFNIIGQDSANWTLATSAAGPDEYLHEISTDGGVTWTTIDQLVYKTWATGIGPGSAATFDLRITVPTSDSSNGATQDVSVIIQAVQQ